MIDSKQNKIVIEEIRVQKNTINYKYNVYGEWKKYFNIDQNFCIQYSIDISTIPQSIAVIPLLANLLPVAWVCDAEIVLPICDKAFYESIDAIKEGYCGMFPMIELKGNITTKEIEENHPGNENGTVAFFSGGVDAFNTLVNHVEEHPTLLTLWGADVKHHDKQGWDNIVKHLKDTSEEFNVDYVTSKTSFRMFLNEKALDNCIAKSGDQWYHGFQCGIGIICHAAPICYVMHKETIFFASSYTANDEYTSATDPTIDNQVHFGDTHVVHDGYDFSRQMKIHNLVEYTKKKSKTIQLRVCWASEGGGNCCECEKCWRTILGLYAEKSDPKQFGFDYKDFPTISKHMKKNAYKFSGHGIIQFYSAIMSAMHTNYTLLQIEPNLRWFYKRDIKHLSDMPFYFYILRCLRIKAGYVKYKIATWLKILQQ